ncbi:MAG TPA: cell division topological specificity factor MinE [Tissierellaceae bacterium]|nr:cell division topological specificity factor MinE [Tissierellaceae bacterium]
MDLFRIFSRRREKSKNVAKERLKLVLVHDRSDISPKYLEMIKEDIIKVVSEYLEIDEDGLDIKLTRMKREKDTSAISAVVANIPILKVKENK